MRQEQPGSPGAAESNAGQSPIIGTVKASVPPQPAAPSIRAVAFASSEHGWLLLDGQAALETRDGGQTWRYYER